MVVLRAALPIGWFAVFHVVLQLITLLAHPAELAGWRSASLKVLASHCWLRGYLEDLPLIRLLELGLEFRQECALRGCPPHVSNRLLSMRHQLRDLRFQS